MKNVFLLVITIILGITFMFSIQTYAVKTKPKLDARYENTSAFSLDKAPKNSLAGKLVEVSGDVFLQSRISTEAAKINISRDMLQGETLITTSGSATIQYENISRIIIQPNSELYFVQTLPSNIVFGQYQGIVEYNRIGETPLSVRAMHLLISQDIGSMLVSINLEDEEIIIDVIEGKITVAFNDLDYNSKVLEIAEGKTLIFNDVLREAEIE